MGKTFSSLWALFSPTPKDVHQQQQQAQKQPQVPEQTPEQTPEQHRQAQAVKAAALACAHEVAKFQALYPRPGASQPSTEAGPHHYL